MSGRSFRRLNFVPSSYEIGDTGGSNGFMELSDGNGQPGYDLDYGIGAEPIHSPPDIMARGFRQERIIMTHEGQEAYDDAYDDPKLGFRWRANLSRV